MERRHDLGNTGPPKTQMPSHGQRVPPGVASTRQRADVATPRGLDESGHRRTALNRTESTQGSRFSFRRRRVQLIALVVLLGLWGAIVSSRSPSPTPLRNAAGSANVNDLRRVSTKAATFPRLKRELLAIPHEPYMPPPVRLFSVPPPPPPPVVAAQPAAPPSPPPPDPFLEAAKQLRFVGFLKSDASVAAIITQGTQLYIAARGDTVAERFRVVSVHEDTVNLASPEGDKQVRLALAAAAGTGAVPIAMVSPSTDGGRAEGASAGDVVARSEPETAKLAPVASAAIPSRAERSEMYRSLARRVQQ